MATTNKVIDFAHPASEATPGSGLGDMVQSVYDRDNDGVVDNAERVGNIPASQLVKTTDVIDCGSF